jgi:hypothetical protein
VKDGLARTDDLKAPIEGGTLGGSGTIDPADGVEPGLMTVPSSEATQAAAARRRFMTTALANQQGASGAAAVTGTMSEPRVAPDVQRVAEMKLKSPCPPARSAGLTSASRRLGAPG